MRISKILKSAFIAFMAIALGSCTNMNDQPDQDQDSPAGPAALARFGFTAETPKAETDPQPFGARVAAVIEQKQIYFNGLSYLGETKPRLIDFKNNTATLVYTEEGSRKNEYPHVSVGARLGPKGEESVVSIVFMPEAASFTVGENKGTVAVEVWNGTKTTLYEPFKGQQRESFSLYLCNWGNNLYYQLNSELSAAAGDMNGDGKEEIGFCVGNRFILLDGGLSQVLLDVWATGNGAADTDVTTIHPSRVTASDITGDGSAEFITTYGSAKLNAVGSYRIYGGASAQVLAAGTLSGGDRPLGMMYANVAVGDLDGDSTKEIIFAGRQDVQINSCNVIAANWDESISNLAFWSKGKSIPVNGNDWGFHPIPPLVAFNPQLTRASDHGTPDTLLAWNSILRCEAKNSDFTEGFKGLTSIGLPVYTNVFAADLNGDQRDELVSLSSVGGVGIEIFGLGTGNTFAVDTIPVTVGTFFTLGAADLTAQSLILRYTGTSVKYTNPKIIAVIASPPFYANAADTPAFGNAGTSLGMTSSASQTKANVFSVNANFSFGATANCPLWGDLGDLEIKYTFGASFSTGFERTTETSCTHRYTTLAGSDAVVYSCVPYDVYSYEVLHSPNANAIGTSVTVDIPRSPQVILMDKDLFNLIPENPLLVESSILTHSIGDPYTYMNLTQATALFTQNPKGLIDVEGINSPSGDNQVAESIVCITDSKGTSYGGGLSFTVSVEEVAFGALFGAEMGFSDEFTYTVQTSESTELSGAVPGSSLAENQVFKFGILGYQKTEPSLQATPFMVVSYWVGR